MPCGTSPDQFGSIIIALEPLVHTNGVLHDHPQIDKLEIKKPALDFGMTEHLRLGQVKPCGRV